MRPKNPPPSPDMHVITLPIWFEGEAAAHIAHSFFGERRSGRTFEFPYKAPPNYVVSSELEETWVRAAKRYPERPADGQIELFSMIQVSMPEPADHWVTDKVAAKWIEKVRGVSDELANLWLQISPNIVENVDQSSSKFRADEIYQTMPGLEELRAFLARLECQSPPHGIQSQGHKADKRYFIRKLSEEMKSVTERWRHSDVALIASVIFGEQVEAPHVHRATQDLSPATPKEDLAWRKRILNPGDHPSDQEQTD